MEISEIDYRVFKSVDGDQTAYGLYKVYFKGKDRRVGARARVPELMSETLEGLADQIENFKQLVITAQELPETILDE